MAVEPASRSQAQSVRRLSRREPSSRRRRRNRLNRRQPDKFLSDQRRHIGAPRPANNFGLGHGSGGKQTGPRQVSSRQPSPSNGISNMKQALQDRRSGSGNDAPGSPSHAKPRLQRRRPFL